MHPRAYKKRDKLLNICRSKLNDTQFKIVKGAVEEVQELLGDQRLKHGEYKFEHVIGVATIICDELNLGVKSIVSTLYHVSDIDTVHIREKYGDTIYDILNGITTVNKLESENSGVHSDNFRKLMMSLAGDVRVILIKLCDKLYEMRHIQYLDEEDKEDYAHTVFYLFSPFAHRLGLYKLNSELQDRSLKILKPEEYNHIEKKLESSQEFINNFVSEFVAPIENNLKEKGLNFSMKARTKSIYSIYNKMSKQNIEFDSVLDIFAIRVILADEDTLAKEKEACWKAFSVVTEEYKSNPERLKDWITNPKSNGYASLHTTLLGPHNKWVEVQIRTERMNDIAEHGVAAHWRYKGGGGSSELDGWLRNIRDIMENPDMESVEFLDHLKTDVYKDELFVFTPSGELRRLIAGATVLDFAYEIHSAVGNSCNGATVNGVNVTIKHKLQNGDTVSINRSKVQKPKLDWLNFVVTSKAISRIKYSINEEKRQVSEQGRETIKRKLKNWKVDYNDRVIQSILDEFKYKYSIDFYYDVEIGKLDTIDIKQFLTTPKVEEEQEQEQDSSKLKLAETLNQSEFKKLTFDSSDDFLVIDNNLTGLIFNLSKCCKPVQGDKIFGFISISDGIKIHRSSCPNAPDLKSKYPYRIIEAKWRSDTTSKRSYQTTLYISGHQSHAIIGDVTTTITRDLGVSLLGINATTDGGQLVCKVDVAVYDIEHLDNLIHRINKIKGVEDVIRVE